MHKMKLFLDTHNRDQGTFPEQIDREGFAKFFSAYEQACREEGVVILRVHVGLEAGRAFCFNMATDEDAIRRAHEKVGLPFDSITEVSTATPGDLFFAPTG